MAISKLTVQPDRQPVELNLGGIVVGEQAYVENIELGGAADADPVATAWAMVEQLEEEQLRLAAELQVERQHVARLKARLAEYEKALARYGRHSHAF